MAGAAPPPPVPAHTIDTLISPWDASHDGGCTNAAPPCAPCMTFMPGSYARRTGFAWGAPAAPLSYPPPNAPACVGERSGTSPPWLLCPTRGRIQVRVHLCSGDHYPYPPLRYPFGAVGAPTPRGGPYPSTQQEPLPRPSNHRPLGAGGGGGAHVEGATPPVELPSPPAARGGCSQKPRNME